MLDLKYACTFTLSSASTRETCRGTGQIRGFNNGNDAVGIPSFNRQVFCLFIFVFYHDIYWDYSERLKGMTKKEFLWRETKSWMWTKSNSESWFHFR